MAGTRIELEPNEQLFAAIGPPGEAPELRQCQPARLPPNVRYIHLDDEGLNERTCDGNVAQRGHVRESLPHEMLVLVVDKKEDAGPVTRCNHRHELLDGPRYRRPHRESPSRRFRWRSTWCRGENASQLAVRPSVRDLNEPRLSANGSKVVWVTQWPFCYPWMRSTGALFASQARRCSDTSPVPDGWVCLVQRKGHWSTLTMVVVYRPSSRPPAA